MFYDVLIYDVLRLDTLASFKHVYSSSFIFYDKSLKFSGNDSTYEFVQWLCALHYNFFISKVIKMIFGYLIITMYF